MRTTGWIQLVFIMLLALASWLIAIGRTRRVRVNLLALCAITAIAASVASRRWLSPTAFAVVNDWLPAALLLVPYWQVGQFFTRANPATEAKLAAFDRALFGRLGLRPSQTFLGVGLTMYFQLAYTLVYPLIPMGLVALYLGHRRTGVDYYWIVILISTYICFAVTLFVAALPPRLLPGYEGFRTPSTTLGAFNRAILNRAGIQTITFPSAHVASSVAAALVLLRVETWIGAIFLLIAVSIALATVVCGYHYAADVLLAVVIALAVFGCTLICPIFAAAR